MLAASVVNENETIARATMTSSRVKPLRLTPKRQAIFAACLFVISDNFIFANKVSAQYDFFLVVEPCDVQFEG